MAKRKRCQVAAPRVAASLVKKKKAVPVHVSSVQRRCWWFVVSSLAVRFALLRGSEHARPSQMFGEEVSRRLWIL